MAVNDNQKKTKKIEDAGIPALKPLTDFVGGVAGFGKPSPVAEQYKRNLDASQSTQAAQGTLGSVTTDPSGTAAQTPGVNQFGNNTQPKPVIASSNPNTTLASNVTPAIRPDLSTVRQDLNDVGSTINFKDPNGNVGSVTSNQTFSDRSLGDIATALKQNADPGFRERLKEQAAISQKRYDNYFDKEKQSNLENNLMNAYKRNDLNGIALFKDLLQERGRSALTREEISNRKDIASLSAESDMFKSANKAQNEYNKFNIETSGKNAELISKLNADVMATPLQKLSTLKSAKGKISLGDLDSLLGNDEGYMAARKQGAQGVLGYMKDMGLPYEMFSDQQE